MSQIEKVSQTAIDAAFQSAPAPAPVAAPNFQEVVERADKTAPLRMVAGSYVVESMSDAYRLARHYIAAGMVPRGLEGRSPQETLGRVAIAIEYGQQFSWTPAQSLQNIMVVNGRPCLWGDGPIALVLRSGKLFDYTATIEGTGDDRVALFRAVRTGGTTREVRFSVADAKRAGLWGKSGPWSNYPERMLLYRARAFCLRDLFADVLCGIGIAEELDDYAIDKQAEKTAEVQDKLRAIEIHDAPQ